MLNLFVQRKLMRRFRTRTEVKTDFTQGALGGNETITRSAGSVYYFNASGVLTATGDNVAAFTSNGLFIEGQATNLIAAANYRNFSTWTKVGVTMKETTPTLIDGTTAASGLNEILEDALTSEHREAVAWTAATAAKQSVMIAVRRGTGLKHVQVRIYNPTDLFYGVVTYNLDTLVRIGALTGGYSTAYVKGSNTIIELVSTNVTTGVQNLYVNIHNGTGISYAGSGVDTLILDWAQVVTSGSPQSHIQGAATRYPSIISRPWIGATTNFWVYIDAYYLTKYNMLPSAVLTRLCSVYASSTNILQCYFINDTGQVRLDHLRLGVQTLGTTSTMLFDRGARLRAVMSIDSVNGARLRINFGGTAFTANISGAPEISALSSGSSLYLANYNDTLDRIPSQEMASYKVGTGILTLAQQIEFVGV